MSDTKVQPENRPLGKRNWLAAGVTVLVAGIAGVSWYVWLRTPADPLPYMVAGAVNYHAYYPKPVPDGYLYVAGSAKLDQGSIIVYKLRLGGKVITVTQQPIPASPPDLSHLPEFTQGLVPAGNAAFGQADGRPSAIILAPSALVTLEGSANVSPGEVHDVAGALRIF